MIDAKIVADSVGPNGARITTFVLIYPRFIHSEFMTHRVFSRNASSSRAIPVKKQIQWVIDNPAIPLAFTKNKAGMQGGDALANVEHEKAKEAWLLGRDEAVKVATSLANLEVHKQYANRVLEPYAHITVVCTATDFANFFALRCHEMAQPEIHALADLMYSLYTSNAPTRLTAGQWHLPFTENLQGAWNTQNAIEASVARCARVSYLNHEGKESTYDEDKALYDRLIGQTPIHASPAEHQAMATTAEIRSGNFNGWIQFRQTLDHQNIKEFKK